MAGTKPRTIRKTATARLQKNLAKIKAEAASSLFFFESAINMTHFEQLVPPDARLERLATGAVWSEGPAYFAHDDSLVWSDIPNNRLLRWSVQDGMTVWRSPANFENGHYFDAENRLLSCEHGRRCISRTEHDGSVMVLVDRFEGKRLNSPNDLVVKSDGTIWFTDPPYGIVSNREGYQAESELGDNFVFRFDPATKELSIVTDVVEEPNGLAFSPDESILYVADTSCAFREDGNHHIMQFDIVDGRKALNPRLFAEINPGAADGFRLDIHGNIFTSAADGVHIYTPDATFLGKIAVPEIVGNVTFGGPQKNRLFIAASTSLYAVTLNTRGIQKP
jgi:gluconolactonase